MNGGRVVVRGGLVVRPDRVGAADVVIAGGRIAAVLRAGTADVSGPRGTVVVIEAGGLAVFPGAVDPHVHFDEPGRTEWEGFDHGSAAAAAGGVTTVVDMPIDSDPPTVTAGSVRDKAAAARSHSRVDVALWGGLVPRSTEQLDAMAAEGVVGFKAFACPSGWEDFPPVDERTLRAGFRASARHGLPVAVHCELERLGHTAESEVEAVRWAAALASSEGGRLHVVHASSADAVEAALVHRRVTVETCPHYLALTDGDAERIGPDAHCAPPIRDATNQERLWSLVSRGAVSCVASDHSPCPPDMKEGPHPWAGISGVETTLSVLLTAGRLGLIDVARLMTGAARLLRLPRKGQISPGYDADLALVDLDAIWVPRAETLWCRHRRSPFTGRPLQGRVVRTLVRGRTVYTLDGGPADPGGALLVRPAPSG